MQAIVKNAFNKLGKKQIAAITALVTLLTPKIFSFFKTVINEKNRIKENNKALFVGIELGGTNYNIAIGRPILNSKGELVDFEILSTDEGRTFENPQSVIDDIVKFLKSKEPQDGYSFIGISSFGPLCLDSNSPLYGAITTTPKKLWRNLNLLERMKTNFFPNEAMLENNQQISQIMQKRPSQKINVGIDTDVNAAALAQFTLGHHTNVKESLIYITVGTGVGVGAIINKKCVHGLTHPQGGHIIIQRHPEEYINFTGVCPYHHSCLEGMVANKSIAERLNIPFTNLHEISDQEKVWRVIGSYLGQLCLNVTLLMSPEVIIIGGGIMNRKILYDEIRKEFLSLLAKYVEHPLFTEQNVHNYIKAPSLGGSVGVKGAMILKYQNEKSQNDKL